MSRSHCGVLTILSIPWIERQPLNKIRTWAVAIRGWVAAAAALRPMLGPTALQHRNSTGSNRIGNPIRCFALSIRFREGPFDAATLPARRNVAAPSRFEVCLCHVLDPHPSPEDLCETHQTLHSVYGHGTCGLVAMMSAPHAEGRTFDLVQA